MFARRHQHLPLGVLLAVVLTGLLTATPASAAPEPGTPVVVNSSSDSADINIGDGVCFTGSTNVDGEPECTLRAAIQETNEGRADHIHFNVPALDPNADGTHRVIPINTALPLVGADTEIEGNTQPGFSGTPVIELRNSAAVLAGLRFVDANGGSAEYLSITDFFRDGIEVSNSDNIRIANNYVGITPSRAALGNERSGIRVNGTSRNTVVVNNAIGANAVDGITVTGSATDTSVDGNSIGTLLGANLGNGRNGVTVLLDAHNTSIGTNEGNVIGFNAFHGINVNGPDGAEILNNQIGHDLILDRPIPNTWHGIVASGGSHVVVGSVAQPNTVASNGMSGVVAANGPSTVVGNFIGTDSSGRTGVGNGEFGVFISSNAESVVLRNAIHNNGNDGVFTLASASVFSQNSILGNGDQPIDLGNDGFTPNDPGDTDTGPSDLLNFPEIADITNTTSGASITLNIDVPAGDYTIELFEYQPTTTDFNNTNHFVRSFPFTSTGTATTQTFTGFTATPGNNLAATTTGLSRGITSELSPTAIVPTAIADDSDDQPPPTTTPPGQPTTGGEPTPDTPTTNPTTRPATNNAAVGEPTATQNTTTPLGRPNGPAFPGLENLGAEDGPSALPFRDEQDTSALATEPLLEETAGAGETESTESLLGGSTDRDVDAPDAESATPAQAADIQSSSLTLEAEAIIEQSEPELTSIDGITIRTERVFNELVDVRLSGFELSSLVLAPIVLIGFFLALRRRPELVSVNRIACNELVSQHSNGPLHPIRHDQLLWSTNRTKKIENQPHTLVETARGNQVWIPTRNITGTGF